jgi:translocation and assembly module TamA
VDIYVESGPPLIINKVNLQLQGEGESLPELLTWLEQWSLRKGDRLVQPTWDQLKDEALDISREWGYLDARFAQERIELNLEDNTADLVLVLDTGPRSVMGVVTYEQDEVLDIVLQPQPRFEQGDPYKRNLHPWWIFE